MLNVLILFLLVAFSLFILPRALKSKKGILIAIAQLAAFMWFASKLPIISLNNIEITIFKWIPTLGLNFEFMLDGLSMAFALLITGIGALVFIYAHSYMKSYNDSAKFFFFLLLFSAAMLGLVLSANLIQLFIFWELTTVLSFFLISFFHEKEASRKAAFQSLVITFMGGLALLAGIVLIGSIVDSYSITEWVAGADQIKASNLYLPGLLLILIGVFTKSAQFPFHFWLPGAMQAPAPVSAYLHSATMVKAGVFLLARLSPVLGGTDEWTLIIPFFGVITMFIGAYLAITQTDLKAILAYTTINSLGVLILLIGIDTMLSIKAAVLFLFIHAFYKASLFMIAGFIEKKTGTRDINELGGLAKSFPITFAITLLALISMAGLPPMLGFIGKELIYEAKVESPGFGALIFIFGFLSNVLMFAVAVKILFKVFLGKAKNSYNVTKLKNAPFVIGAGVLVLASLIFGIAPSLLGKWIIAPAINVIYSEPVTLDLALWHGFNFVLALSGITVALGIALSIILLKNKQLESQWQKCNRVIIPVKFPEVFNMGLQKFITFSTNKTKMLQHGYHRYYILTIIAFTAVLLWIQLYVTRGWEFDLAFSFKPFYISGLVLIISLATLFTVLTRSRIAAIISMGVMGYGLALIFLYYSAVDLAITQILSETLIVVMFMLILQRLPMFSKLSSRATKIRDLVIAILFGTAMTLVTIKAINVNLSTPISEFFMNNSFSKAHGENVVNVILVDFRALDTLGEVTVLVIAALGVAALLSTQKIKK